MTKGEHKLLGKILGGRDPLAGVISWWKSKAPKRKPASYQKQKTLSGRGARAALVAEVRPQVEARANGRCECCGSPFTVSDPAEWDEFHGRRHVTVEETWLLQRSCHRSKTENYPAREAWDERFKMHCAIYRLPFRKRFFKDLARLPSRSEPHDRMERSAETAGGRSLSTESK